MIRSLLGPRPDLIPSLSYVSSCLIKRTQSVTLMSVSNPGVRQLDD